MQIGRYRTQRPIASGGMATVYLGRAEGAEGFAREVAIKVMHPHLATDDEFVAKLVSLFEVKVFFHRELAALPFLESVSHVLIIQP